MEAAVKEWETHPGAGPGNRPVRGDQATEDSAQFARSGAPEPQHGGVETMRAVVDRLQGPAPEPPGRVALRRRLRPGTGPSGRGAPVPDVTQPLPGIGGPEGDQFQTPDVTGEPTSDF